MCTKNYRVYGWKTQNESTNWGRVYQYHELISEAAFSFGIGFTDRLLGNWFVLNFVNRGKVISLPKVMKYLKRSKYSFHNFSTKHMPSATLTNEKFNTKDPLSSSILSQRIHCHQQKRLKI